MGLWVFAWILCGPRVGLCWCRSCCCCCGRVECFRRLFLRRRSCGLRLLLKLQLRKDVLNIIWGTLPSYANIYSGEAFEVVDDTDEKIASILTIVKLLFIRCTSCHSCVPFFRPLYREQCVSFWCTRSTSSVDPCPLASQLTVSEKDGSSDWILWTALVQKEIGSSPILWNLPLHRFLH